MSPVSQSLQKLSGSMADLSQRAKVAEDDAAATRTQTREQLEARLAEAKAAADRRHEEDRARAASLRDEMSARWNQIRTDFHDQFDEIRAKLEEGREDLDAKVAQNRADRAEANAGDAVQFALDAIDEADVAVLYAADARAIADSYTESTS